MILHVENISKSFGKEKVLDNLSFCIKENQIIALVGPNGSGKTTLLNIITGLLKADTGMISLLNMSHPNPSIFKKVSFMQDNSVLYNYLTGYDHLQFIGNVQGLSKQDILAIAERVGMMNYLNKKVSKYSLGMKQHLLLTMAILNKPDLLILDEPLNGLDPTSMIRVRHLLLELHREGTAILLSSHNLSEIDRLTSHILFLKNGSLIEEDISGYINTFYMIEVSPVTKAIKVLETMGVLIDQVENNKLYISRQDHIIHDVLLKLIDNQVEIIDFNKKMMGSEQRYQTIFGEGL